MQRHGRPGDTVVGAARAEAVPAWLATTAGAIFAHHVLPAGEGHAHDELYFDLNDG